MSEINTDREIGISAYDVSHAALAKPPMFCKDLRLSSADLLNPLSSDIMQSSTTTVDYSPHEFGAQLLDSSTLPPGLLEQFTSVDELSLPSYESVSQPIDAQNKNVSAVRVVTRASHGLEHTAIQGGSMMPTLTHSQVSSGGLTDYFDVASQEAWLNNDTFAMQYEGDNKRSSQTTLLNSSSSATNPSCLQMQLQMQTGPYGISDTDFFTQPSGSLIQPVDPCSSITSNPSSRCSLGATDLSNKTHRQDSIFHSGNTALQAGDQWPYAFDCPQPANAPSNTDISPTTALGIPPLIGTASFSKSFMERLGETSDDHLAGAPLDISDDAVLAGDRRASNDACSSFDDLLSTRLTLALTAPQSIHTLSPPMHDAMSLLQPDAKPYLHSAIHNHPSHHLDLASSLTHSNLIYSHSASPSTLYSDLAVLDPSPNSNNGFHASPSLSGRRHSLLPFNSTLDDYAEQNSPLRSYSIRQRHQEYVMSPPPRLDMQLSMSENICMNDYQDPSFSGRSMFSDQQLQQFSSGLTSNDSLLTHTLPAASQQQSLIPTYTMPHFEVKYNNNNNSNNNNTQKSPASCNSGNLPDMGVRSSAKRANQRRRTAQARANQPFSTPFVVPGSSTSKILFPQATSQTEGLPPLPKMMRRQMDMHPGEISTSASTMQVSWGGSGHTTDSSLGLATNSTNANINRRKMVEQSFFCGACQADMGMIYVRASATQEQLDAISKLSCIACENQLGNPLWNGKTPSSVFDLPTIATTATTTHASFDSTTSMCDQRTSPTSSRKRSRTVVPTTSCEVCKHILGVVDMKAHAAATLLRPEFVCKPCGDAYMFCSECGGGGKQRTGKWRPRELFERGRRTCSLPHVRVGSAQVNYQVIDTAHDLLPDVMNGIQDVFYDCMLSLYAVPAMIRMPKYGSFHAVRSDIESIWQTSVMSLLMQAPPSHIRRYLTVAWMDKRHRNKGKGKFSIKDNASWLNRIDIQQVVATATSPVRSTAAEPLSAASALSISPTSTQLNFSAGPESLAYATLDQSIEQQQFLESLCTPEASPVTLEAMPLLQGQTTTTTTTTRPSAQSLLATPDEVDETNRSYIAFSMMEWDLQLNTIFITQMAPRSVFLKSLDQYIDLVHEGIAHVMRDAHRSNLNPPNIIWGWTRSDHIRLLSVPSRLGFIPQEQFLLENPLIGKHIFERPGFTPLVMEGTHVFAQNIALIQTQQQLKG
ncbi:hypothetical protein BASA50_008907 [Batrachochytrium salamandrivorans]|uniref:Zinc-ribbon domain-containing protein n=1 Tax=Batrachochytrium salamandrivorans TaxID=1357716 RepID=A0ABQ8F5I4_9FUNG|nr:hypothetical protein BASA62_007605 [Batrachochytrium salamandrivorans]KAH6590906.1 hypothetical protein BASA50_008907 [Batrachochytrium salamandrivorans]KAH9268359.1 hypothetical protein BASA84_000273 [Batrachochytrium salamandrivorans]KAJ1343323.1 hypothetical protein BSLG_002349 [Batrachochytrium salamandrivorans]